MIAEILYYYVNVVRHQYIQYEYRILVSLTGIGFSYLIIKNLTSKFQSSPAHDCVKISGIEFYIPGAKKYS